MDHVKNMGNLGYRCPSFFQTRWLQCRLLCDRLCMLCLGLLVRLWNLKTDFFLRGSFRCFRCYRVASVILFWGVFFPWFSGAAGIPADCRTLADALIERFVPEESVNRLILRLTERDWNSAHVTKLLESIRQSIDMGLPAEPFMSKAFEGISKGIDPERIVDALERVRARYQSAYRQARHWFPLAEARLAAIADIIAEANASGMGTTDIDTILQSARQAQMAGSGKMPSEDDSLQLIRNAMELSRMGVSSASVTDMLIQATVLGISISELNSLPKMMLECTSRVSADQLAEQLIQGMRQGRGFLDESLEVYVQKAAKSAAHRQGIAAMPISGQSTNEHEEKGSSNQNGMAGKAEGGFGGGDGSGGQNAGSGGGSSGGGSGGGGSGGGGGGGK